MNCKPGDLAFVVRTANKPQALGAIVQVIKPYDGSYPWKEPAWWIEWRGNDNFHCPDSFLRPLPPLADADSSTIERQMLEPA